jgi:CDP-glycerol glycerophosphotransferase
MSGKPGNFMTAFLRKLRKLFAIPAGALLTWMSKVKPNKIIFMTFNHTYSCNPKYICQELLRQKLPVDIVWVVKPDKPIDTPEGVRQVVYGTFAYLKEVATAKVWVDNAFGFSWNPIPIKKKNQFYIQTWHGSLGLKRIGKENVKNKRWSFAARLNAKWVDLCISNSAFETDVFRQTHWPKNAILELGHARNDVLFAENAAIAARVRQHFGIQDGTKIALYAPTFRNDDATACYDLDHSRLLDALAQKFGGAWVLLNRYHMKTLKARDAQVSDPRILDATAYPDIQELMVASDVGITDYSSWICDFVLTGRPGFLYAPDLAVYDRERGFYYPLEETPFPIAQSNDELMQNILDFDARLYADKKDQFLAARGCKETGSAAKQIVEVIKQQCGITR